MRAPNPGPCPPVRPPAFPPGLPRAAFRAAWGGCWGVGGGGGRAWGTGRGLGAFPSCSCRSRPRSSLSRFCRRLPCPLASPSGRCTAPRCGFGPAPPSVGPGAGYGTGPGDGGWRLALSGCRVPSRAGVGWGSCRFLRLRRAARVVRRRRWPGSCRLFLGAVVKPSLSARRRLGTGAGKKKKAITRIVGSRDRTLPVTYPPPILPPLPPG